MGEKEQFISSAFLKRPQRREGKTKVDTLEMKGTKGWGKLGSAVRAAIPALQRLRQGDNHDLRPAWAT